MNVNWQAVVDVSQQQVVRGQQRGVVALRQRVHDREVQVLGSHATIISRVAALGRPSAWQPAP
jgi:hypothetical protein